MTGSKSTLLALLLGALTLGAAGTASAWWGPWGGPWSGPWGGPWGGGPWGGGPWGGYPYYGAPYYGYPGYGALPFYGPAAPYGVYTHAPGYAQPAPPQQGQQPSK